MVVFWCTTVVLVLLNIMRSLTMPWQASGSKQTATLFCDTTRSMMAVMVVSAFLMVAKVLYQSFFSLFLSQSYLHG